VGFIGEPATDMEIVLTYEWGNDIKSTTGAKHCSKKLRDFVTGTLLLLVRASRKNYLGANW